jgi:hypothetical protein
MPYIKREFRKELDNEIWALGDAIKEIHQLGQSERAGLLNYAITKLLLQVYPKSEESYHTYNEAMGMLGSCTQEYYRKHVAPYEIQKEYDNGDVE